MRATASMRNSRVKRGEGSSQRVREYLKKDIESEFLRRENKVYLCARAMNIEGARARSENLV